MNNKLLAIILIINIALLSGCSSTGPVHNQPNFIVTADVKNDPVPDITPSLISSLSKKYAASTSHNEKDFIKVVNELKVGNGIVYLGRVKDGFCIEYVEEQTNKVYFLITRLL